MSRVCGRRPRKDSARQRYEPCEGFCQQSSHPIEGYCLLRGSARRCLLASSLCCHDAFTSASTPGPAHQTCAPLGRLERDVSSVAVEIMTSVMSVLMSLVQVPSRIVGGAEIIAFASWHRRFGPVINRRRSAFLKVFLVLSLLLRFGANLRGMRTFAHNTR